MVFTLIPFPTETHIGKYWFTVYRTLLLLTTINLYLPIERDTIKFVA